MRFLSPSYISLCHTAVLFFMFIVSSWKKGPKVLNMENITAVSLHVFSLNLLSIHVYSYLFLTFFQLCEVSHFPSDF